jgi:hypothetical protein
MSVLENMPEYQQLDAADQIKVRSGVATQAEKLRKEAEKDYEITTAREHANAAASGATTLVEGYKWIDENVKDPQIAEKARTMFKSEFDAVQDARKVEYDAMLEKTAVDIENAVESGDTAAAWKAYEAAQAAGLEFDDQVKFRDKIKTGKKRSDDQSLLDRIDALKLGSKDDRLRFAKGGPELWNALGITSADYIGMLTRDTRNKIEKEQEGMSKELAGGGDIPSLAAPGALFKSRVTTLGIDDPAMTERLQAMYQRNLQTAAGSKGANLTPVEEQDVLDQTFMQFREEGRNKPFVTVEEVLTKFSKADEMQGVPDGTNYSLAVTQIAEAVERQKVELEKKVRALESQARSHKAFTQYDVVSEYVAVRGQLDALNRGGFVTGAALDDWLQRSLGKKADPDAIAAAQKASPPAGRQSAADAAEYAAAEERQRQTEERETQVDPSTPAGRVAAAREQFGLDDMRDAEVIQFLKERGAWPFGN